MRYVIKFLVGLLLVLALGGISQAQTPSHYCPNTNAWIVGDCNAQSQSNLIGLAFYCEAYTDLAACVSAANSAGGGTVYVSTPGVGAAASYTITDTVQVGVNQTAKVSVHLGPGVRIACNLTSTKVWRDCFDLADGSSLIGDAGTYTLNSSSVTTRPMIIVSAGSKVSNVVTALDWSGSKQQGITVGGITFAMESSTTSLIAHAQVHAIGLFSGSKFFDLTPSNLYQTIGILADNFDKTTFNNGTNGLTVAASGTTVTMTLPTSTTPAPTAHHLNWNSSITVAGCNGGTAANPANANGNYVISNLGSGAGTLADAQTKFQYTAGASVGTGTVTGCTFVATTPTFTTGQGITSVVTFENVVDFGSGSDNGQRPLVITQNGNGTTSALTFSGTQNYENFAVGGKAIEINGNGCGFCVFGIDFPGHLHMEPISTGSGLYIRDAFAVMVGGVDGSGSGDKLIEISQSGSNKTGGIQIGPIYNLNWTTSLTNSINGDRINNYGSNGMLTTGYLYNGNSFGGPANTMDNPEDVSQFLWRDEFIGNSATASSFGLGWTSHVTGTGTIATGNGTFPNVSTAQIGTGGTSASFSSLALDKNGEVILPAVSSNVPWSNTIVLNISTVTAGTSRTRFGFGTAANTSNIPTNGIYFRLDTDAGIADTNWQICYDVSSVETCASTGVAASTSYFRFRMHSEVSGKVTASVNGGSEVSLCPSGCTATATAPAGNLAPFVQIVNDQSATYTINLDFWAFKQWALAR